MLTLNGGLSMTTRSKSKTEKVTPIKKSAGPKAGAANQQGSLFSLANIRKDVGTPADDSQPSLKAGAIEVHKPSAQDIVRVHPEQRFLGAQVFELKQSKKQELYLIMGGFEIPEEVAGLVSRINLFRACNQFHSEFVWPVKIGENLFNQTSQTCVYAAMKSWVRVFNKGSFYEPHVMHSQLPAPEWSGLSFEQIIEAAFADRLITSADHRVVRLLQGLPESDLAA
jgi:hypothetical protein